MNEQALSTYRALEPGQLIGPDRHRFKLVNAGPSQPPGQLWAAEDQSTRELTPVSLIIFDPAQFPDQDQIGRLRDALNRTRSLNSARLIPTFGHFSFRNLLFFATPPIKGLSLAQLIEQKKLDRLNQKQLIGLSLQLGKALHTIQMGRLSHGTLCPELIFINPGQGCQLLGTLWYNAIDPDNTSLSYAQYQLPSDLQRGTASTLGDTYALAKLIQQIFNQGKYPVEQKPNALSDAQWALLASVISDPAESEIKTPLQLVRELFGETPDADSVIADSSLEVAPSIGTTESDAAAIEAPDHPESDAAASQSKQQGIPQSAPDSPDDSIPTNRGITLARLRGWDRPLWLILGIIIGLGITRLLEPETLPEMANTSAESSVQSEAEALPEPSPGAAAVITQSASDPTPLDPAENTETLTDNHLIVFQDQVDEHFKGPLMIKIPVGHFQMGDLQGAGDDNEQPVREVSVDKAYALSQYEITFTEYDLFARDTGRALPNDEGWGRGDRPVINVSWQDAQAYTSWLAALTGQPYRLPTEAEWEYAARAGTESAYWWGNRLEEGLARCDGCENGERIAKTAPVGSYPANPWGLFDLNGNVDEWVADCYSDTYLGGYSDQRAFRLGDCSQRVMRGGSWFEIPRLVRSSSRYRHPANTARNSWGFRVALDLGPN